MTAPRAYGDFPLAPPLRMGLLLAAAAALLLPMLGAYPLFDVDEGAFSEATREMLESGNWLSTTLNGAPRYDKPILVYWLQALSVATFGLNEFALRLPSAAAALAWVLAIVRFCDRRLGTDTAILAGWIAASSLAITAMGRAATADALLNAIIAATLFDVWRHLESGDRAALRRAWCWMALGALAKGPVALLIPLATGIVYCASAGRMRAAARALLDPAGIALFLLIAGPWYAAQYAVNGRAFIDGFLLHHNLERYGGTLEGHGAGPWYYFAVVPLWLAPWTTLLPRIARGASEDWRLPLNRFLWIWFGFVFVFFTFSATKLPHYVLYGITPLFVLGAQRLHARAHGAALALACVLAALLPLVPALVQAIAEDGRATHDAFYLAQAARARALANPAYYVATVAAAGLALWIALRRRWSATRRTVLASAALSAALGLAFVPWLGALLNAPTEHAARFAQGIGGPAVQWNIAVPSFSVYRGAITPSREPRPGELAVTRIDRLRGDVPVEVLFREGGIALVRRAAQ
jgi:4-amino-4-deoxy-L-arabinose transferase-like glycosyltransferase